MFLKKLVDMYDSDNKKITDYIHVSMEGIGWDEESVRHLTKTYIKLGRYDEEKLKQFDYVPFLSFYRRGSISSEGLEFLGRIRAGRPVSDLFRALNYPPGSPSDLESALEVGCYISETYACVLHASIVDHFLRSIIDPIPKEFHVEEAFNVDDGIFSHNFVNAVEDYARRENIDGKELTRQLGISLPTLKKYSHVSLKHLATGVGRKPEGFKPEAIIEAFNRLVTKKRPINEQGSSDVEYPHQVDLEGLAARACLLRREIKSLLHQKHSIEEHLDYLNGILNEVHGRMDEIIESKKVRLEQDCSREDFALRF